MEKKLSHLNPQPLWNIFENICGIPRPSTKEGQVIEYIKLLCRKHNTEIFVDPHGNMVIRKPATKGKENLKGVILQGHTDMVTEKNTDVIHNFDKDPIIPRIENGWIKATGTTLGADNGIGIAAALAVITSKDIEHGPLECLFTANEETGQTGASQFEAGQLNGGILLNLDSEMDGELTVGCAGGTTTRITFSYNREPVEKDSTCFAISLRGLKGGHSGLDIHLGKGNANKLMGTFLYNISRSIRLRISELNGGTQRNAIPRESFAIVSIPKTEEKNFLSAVDQYAKKIKNDYSAIDPDLKFMAEKHIQPVFVLDQKFQDTFLKAIMDCPNGAIYMSKDISGLVETSINLGVIEQSGHSFKLVTLQRSLIDERREKLNSKLESLFKNAGATVEHSSSYPGWKPELNSEILNVVKERYYKLHGFYPIIKTIHAGLECSLLSTKYPHLDKVSFGPTILAPHSPDERVEIQSVTNFWELLVETLKNIPTK